MAKFNFYLIFLSKMCVDYDLEDWYGQVRIWDSVKIVLLMFELMSV